MDMFSNCSIFKLEQIFNPNFLQEIRKIIIAPNLQNGRVHLFPSNVSLFSIKRLSYVIIQFKFSSRCSFSSSLLWNILIPYAIIKPIVPSASAKKRTLQSRSIFLRAMKWIRIPTIRWKRVERHSDAKSRASVIVDWLKLFAWTIRTS